MPEVDFKKKSTNSIYFNDLESAEFEEIQVIDEKQFRSDVEDYVSKHAHSQTKLNELVEIYKKLILANEDAIEYLQGSNIFQRFWRKITGGQFKANLQSTQFQNDLSKVGLEIFNELNKQMLIQQEQLVLMQDEIGFLVREQTEFRKKLADQLRGIVNETVKRFEHLEKVIGEVTTVALDTKDQLKNIKKQLINQGYRLDTVEREILKINHRVDVIYWHIGHTNRFSGNTDKYSDFDDLFELIEDFLSITRNSPTFKDYDYLRDVLAYYGYESDKSYNAKQLVEDIVQDFNLDPNYCYNVWNERLGTARKTVNRNYLGFSFSHDKPFTAIIDRTLHLCNNEHRTGNKPSSEDIYNKLHNLTPEKVVSKKPLQELISKINNVPYNINLKLDELDFEWDYIALEYISYKKGLLESDKIQLNERNSRQYISYLRRYPSHLANKLNLLFNDFKYNKEKEILSWKRNFISKSFFVKGDHICLDISEGMISIDIKFLHNIRVDEYDLEIKFITTKEQVTALDFNPHEFAACFGLTKVKSVESDNETMYKLIWENASGLFEKNEIIQFIWSGISAFLTHESEYDNVNELAMRKLELIKNKSAIPHEQNEYASVGKINRVQLNDQIIRGAWRVEIKDSYFHDMTYWYKEGNGMYEVHGEIAKLYKQNFENQYPRIGFPISDERDLKELDPNLLENEAFYNSFENGRIEWYKHRTNRFIWVDSEGKEIIEEW